MINLILSGVGVRLPSMAAPLNQPVNLDAALFEPLPHDGAYQAGLRCAMQRGLLLDCSMHLIRKCYHYSLLGHADSIHD